MRLDLDRTGGSEQHKKKRMVQDPQRSDIRMDSYFPF